MERVTFEDIEKAQENLKGVALETLMEHSHSATDYLGTQTYLKFENQQRTGSFKIRGAFNKLCHLTKEELSNGVSACSAGNHAQGVAYGAKLLQAKAHIVMPKTAPIAKVEATKNYGAEIYQHGAIVDEAAQFCKQLSQEKNLTFIHPYEDPHVIAGQGTLGLELYKEVQDLDSIVISIGGGGLISGTALALKHLNPKIKIYGAVSDCAPGMLEGFQHQKEIGAQGAFTARPTIADGIAIKTPSKYIYDNYISQLVDDIVSVTDEEIAQSMVYLLERAKAVVEGAGAAGLAAAKKANWDLGQKTGIILCGGNIDMSLIARVIEKGLTFDGRMSRIRVLIEDSPGHLNKLTEILSKSSANVIDVKHDRVSSYLGLRQTLVEFLLMTRNRDHINEIVDKFHNVGAQVKESSSEL